MAMILTGVARITREPELRSLPSGEPVLQLALAYNYGIKRDERGFLPSQFMDVAYWGQRAINIAEHLHKGDVIQVVLSDVHIEEFRKSDGSPGHKLAARADRIDFVPGQRSEGGDDAPAPATAPQQQRYGQQQRGQAPAQRSAPPRPAPRPAPANSRAGSGFDDMGDDIPF